MQHENKRHARHLIKCLLLILAWKKQLWELDPEDPENNGIQNEDLIVWMRTAALPNFRKLYRIVNASAEGFMGGLPSGNYSLKINYSKLIFYFKFFQDPKVWLVYFEI